MAAFLSSLTDVAMIDARTQSGTVFLPSTQTSLNRILTLKDIYGAVANSTVVVRTSGTDLFEDGTTQRTFRTPFQSLVVYAGQPGYWFTLGGTTQTTTVVSSLTVSSIVSTVQTGPLFASEVNIGRVSTLNSIDFFGLTGNYNNTVLAEISTGTGLQELLIFKGSSASDRVRVQTTGNFVVETGVSARLFNSNTTQTLSNAVPAFAINTSSNVGIQIAPASIAATLDVGGSVRSFTLSSQQLFISSINGQAYAAGGGIASIPSNLSTAAVFTSSVLASTITTSSLTVNSLTIGTGTGWLNLGPLQTVAISSIQANVNDAYLNNVYVGTQSTINDIMFYGLFGNYNNTVLAEISTGAGMQELLVFKGSSASDRVRVQTTGTFVVETGVSARLFNSNTTQTLSNVTPAFLINANSNVGIQTASPGAPLDVAGTSRAITLSSQQLNVSSIVNLNFSSLQGAVSSLVVNGLQFGDGTGWVNMGPIQATGVSTIQGNANTNTTLVTSTLALNVSSINGNAYKSFVIDHPLSENKYLVHACLEGPEAGVYYRGIGTIESDKVSIQLPDYVDALATDFTVQLTPIYEEDEDTQRNLMASRVKHGSFTVKGNPGSFYWHVYGKRLSIEVEPEKSSTAVQGEGPYKWIS